MPWLRAITHTQVSIAVEAEPMVVNVHIGLPSVRSVVLRLPAELLAALGVIPLGHLAAEGL